jgi:serine/threonine-protein kinase
MTDVVFHIERCLGKGGYGEVYLAVEERPDGALQPVAIKVMGADLVDELAAVRRLRDEFHFLAALDHPSIPKVVRIVHLAGRLAIVLELVDGADLAWFTHPLRLPPPGVVMRIGARVADALSAAYTFESPETGRPLKLVHRDVKPANIRIATTGAVKLMDFGIARTPELYRSAHTSFGRVPFTKGYAPPETLQDGAQGHATDIWALGVVLYKALVGRSLFRKLSLAHQTAIAEDRTVYLSLLRERLGHVRQTRVLPLLEHMLAHEPTDRPEGAEVAQVAEQMANRLDAESIASFMGRVELPARIEVAGASLTGTSVAEQPLPPDAAYASWREAYGRDAAEDAGPPPLPAFLRNTRTATPAPARDRDRRRS